MAKYIQRILSFEGIVGTEEKIADKLGLSVSNLYSRIYRKHTSMKEITVEVVRLKDAINKVKRETVLHDLTCAECGCSFQFTRKRKLCSPECRIKRANRATLEASRRRPRAAKDVSPRPCLCCDTMFTPNENGATSKYCNIKCQRYMQWKKTSDQLGKKVRHGLAMKISRLLRNGGRSKASGYFKYVGMHGKELFDRITSLMTDGMTIDNYGPFGWHIDHVIPRSLFDMSNEDHVRLCFNWRNMRPLWRDDNVRKFNKVSSKDAAFVGPEYIKELESSGITLTIDV